MRSIDGGQSWALVGSPPSSVDAVDFANRQEGYAYFRRSSGERATFYWTGNGGRTWQLAFFRFPVSRISVNRHRQRARLPTRARELCGKRGVPVSSPCVLHGNERCVGDQGALRLPVGAKPSNRWAWRRFGSKVWLIAIGAAGEARVLSVSSDGGRSSASLPSTGMFGLACNTTATSAMTLWGFCATGSLGYAVRSQRTEARDFTALVRLERGVRSRSKKC